MTRCLWRFALQLVDHQVLRLPYGTAIMSAQYQDRTSAVCIWAWVDPEETRNEPRSIRLLATGEPVSDDLYQLLTFIDTVQLPDATVWHVFEDFSENGGTVQ